MDYAPFMAPEIDSLKSLDVVHKGNIVRTAIHFVYHENVIYSQSFSLPKKYWCWLENINRGVADKRKFSFSWTDGDSDKTYPELEQQKLVSAKK